MLLVAARLDICSHERGLWKCERVSTGRLPKAERSSLEELLVVMAIIDEFYDDLYWIRRSLIRPIAAQVLRILKRRVLRIWKSGHRIFQTRVVWVAEKFMKITGRASSREEKGGITEYRRLLLPCVRAASFLNFKQSGR